MRRAAWIFLGLVALVLALAYAVLKPSYDRARKEYYEGKSRSEEQAKKPPR